MNNPFIVISHSNGKDVKNIICEICKCTCESAMVFSALRKILWPFTKYFCERLIFDTQMDVQYLFELCTGRQKSKYALKILF